MFHNRFTIFFTVIFHATLQERNKPMAAAPRVLLIGLEFVEPLFSGNGVLTHSVVRGLLRIGYHVTVVCARPESTPHELNPTMAIFDQLRVISVPVPDSTWRRLDRKSAWKELAENVVASSVAATDDEYQYVFGVDWSSIPTYRAIQSSLNGSPGLILLVFRVFSRSRELLTSKDESAFYQDRERAAIQAATATFVLSHVDQAELITLCQNHDQEQTFHILVPPLRQDMYDICTRSPKLRVENERRQYLVCNVRLSPEKNAIAFAQIASCLEKNGTLKKTGLVPVLIGTIVDQDYAARVKGALPSSTILMDRFLSTEEMLDYLHQAAVLIHPPVYDAYGMTIAEAAAVSTPAVIHQSHIGASSLFRADEHEIFTADFSNLEAAAATIQRLVEAPEQLHRVGLNARNRSFSWTTTEYAKQLDERLNTLQ